MKRRHREFLINFGEIEGMCPYKTSANELAKDSIELEKRACNVVREVLGMTVEMRTLVDHLTHFRKDFGLPNKLRGMLVRHPELFYVSLKGHRDSVFLVEGYDDRGALLKKDETLVIKRRLMDLVWEGKRLRREKRKSYIFDGVDGNDEVDRNYYDGDDDDYSDDLDTLFESDDSDIENDGDGNDDDDDRDLLQLGEEGKFWIAEATAFLKKREDGGLLESW